MNSADSHPNANQSSFFCCLQGSWVDKALLFVMLGAIAWLWFVIQAQLSQGEPTAYIYHQQQLLASYPLPQDERVIHLVALGEQGESNIEISKQGIRFVSSPCSSQYCTRAGHKAYAGAVLACVPNHIMVVLRGLASTDAQTMFFDAVAE